MANILQGFKFENKNANILKEDVKTLENILEVQKSSSLIQSIMGVEDSISSPINNFLKTQSNILRKKSWVEKGSLPKALKGYYSIDGIINDAYTLLDGLPKINLSKARELANKFNMVIVPIEYTEINKLFELEDNNEQLKNGFEIFKTALKNDFTTKYDIYVLCPISYYSVWQQIKNDKIREIFYAEYFETMFETLELIIPSQKNIYMTTKTNDENIKKIEASLNSNMLIVDKKINKMSIKIDAIENKMIQQFKEQELKNKQMQEEIEGLKNVVVRQQKEIESIYRRLDPICFAVKEGINIVEDEGIATVGLCWGADIDEMIFDMKGVTISHKNLSKINPLNILLKYNIEDIDNNLESEVESIINKELDTLIKRICDNDKDDYAYYSDYINDKHIIGCEVKNYKVTKLCIKEKGTWGDPNTTICFANIDKDNSFRQCSNYEIRDCLKEALLNIKDIDYIDLFNLRKDSLN